MTKSFSTLKDRCLHIAGIYISDLPGRSGPACVTLNGKSFSSDLVRVARNGQILEVDLEGAWKQVESEVEWDTGIAVEVSLE